MFGNDPLLFQSRMPQTLQSEMDIKQQINNTLEQYKAMQQQQQQMQPVQAKDYVGDLDNLVANLSFLAADKLKDDKEYTALSSELQMIIQNELINSVKWKINGNQDAIKNMERQKEIINSIKHSCEEEERRNLNELNDYIKNYSSMTFDEYKKIKSGDEK